MDRQTIIGHVGEWFHESTIGDDGGLVDIHSDYGWQAGCYHNGIWISLAEIVKLIEHICDEEGV